MKALFSERIERHRALRPLQGAGPISRLLQQRDQLVDRLDRGFRQSLPLREKRFGFEPEVTARIARVPNVRIYEVGISYYGRTYAEGKHIGWKDGVRAIYCIAKYNFFSR